MGEWLVFLRRQTAVICRRCLFSSCPALPQPATLNSSFITQHLGLREEYKQRPGSKRELGQLGNCRKVCVVGKHVSKERARVVDTAGDFQSGVRLLRVPCTTRRSNQSTLKEINPKYSLEGLKLKLQYFGHLIPRADSMENTLMPGKIGGRRRDGWIASLTQCTSEQTLGDCEGLGSLVCCSPRGRRESLEGSLSELSILPAAQQVKVTV